MLLWPKKDHNNHSFIIFLVGEWHFGDELSSPYGDEARWGGGEEKYREKFADGVGFILTICTVLLRITTVISYMYACGEMKCVCIKYRELMYSNDFSFVLSLYFYALEILAPNLVNEESRT